MNEEKKNGCTSNFFVCWEINVTTLETAIMSTFDVKARLTF